MANRVNAGQDLPGFDRNNNSTCVMCNLKRHKGKCQASGKAPRRRSARLSDAPLSKAPLKAKPRKPNRKAKRPRSVPNKRRKARRVPGRGRANYKLAIYAVLKYLGASKSISQIAMQIMDDFVNDMFERITTEAMKIMQRDGKATLSTQAIHTAIRLIFPPEMSAHAIYECKKAHERLYQN